MSDYGYHQARMMTTDDIQLVQFHCPVPAHLSSVLRHSGQVPESAEHILAHCELPALFAMEAYLCANIAGCDGCDVLFCLGCDECETAQADCNCWCTVGIAPFGVLQVLQLHQ